MSKAPLTTSELRVAWGPPCSASRGVKVTLHGGATITVDRRIVPAVLALNAIFIKWNYKATPPDCGAFVCRRITGGTGYSLHAYLIAIDTLKQGTVFARDYENLRADNERLRQEVAELSANKARDGILSLADALKQTTAAYNKGCADTIKAVTRLVDGGKDA